MKGIGSFGGGVSSLLKEEGLTLNDAFPFHEMQVRSHVSPPSEVPLGS